MKKPTVTVVMGSQSDYKIMKKATALLRAWNVPVETVVVSAHRTPQLIESSVVQWEQQGVKVIIAGAGGAAHLPGMIASYSVLPVIGVPIKSKAAQGLDALLSIAQMPPGVPVATVSINGADNAALLALKILGVGGGVLSEKISKKMKVHKKNLYKKVLSMRVEVKRLSKKI